MMVMIDEYSTVLVRRYEAGETLVLRYENEIWLVARADADLSGLYLKLKLMINCNQALSSTGTAREDDTFYCREHKTGHGHVTKGINDHLRHTEGCSTALLEGAICSSSAAVESVYC